ncbi:hypothetical protein [Catelliglobosispora koreensis]|uniref:hypothetical protein n=1 Tax=Catelliglobosispora koreensis TaxID=129052 RepID=UPI000366C74D|nr:hypothetical protein [Catelliglobosispora koreensis]
MADLAVFRAQLLRFDPAALVRVQDGLAWAKLPWDVFVGVACDAPEGVISAVDGSAADGQWRGALPPVSAPAVESIPASALKSAAAAAAKTLREMTGRAGERAIRDALLDHIVVRGESDVDGTPFAVPQRLVQAMVRMDLLGSAAVTVRVSGPWTGLTSELGLAFYRLGNPLSVRPIVNQAFGR